MVFTELEVSDFDKALMVLIFGIGRIDAHMVFDNSLHDPISIFLFPSNYDDVASKPCT